MKMRSAKLAACILLLWLTGCNTEKKEHALKKQDHYQHGTVSGKGLLETISSENKILSRQATVRLTAAFNTSVEGAGLIEPDQQKQVSVAARFGGRIEKLYVRYNGQHVGKGSKIMELYSKEVQTLQEEHLFILTNGSSESLIKKSRQRLMLSGIPESQITNLESTNQIQATIPVFSPASGYVFINTVPGSSLQDQNKNSEMPAMNSQKSTPLQSGNISPGTQIREGDYVNAGQTLFELNDLEQVWAVVSLPVKLLTQVYPGQEVTIFQESDSTKKFTGKVLLTEQTFNITGQQFARIRIGVSNQGNRLKAYSFITARFSLDREGSQQLPASAVYKTGLHAFVWVKKGTTAAGTGIFELKKVTAGPTVAGMTSITTGITPEDEVALHAGLLTDSETFLNVY